MAEILEQIIDEIEKRIVECYRRSDELDEGAILGLSAAKIIVQRQLAQLEDSRGV